MTNHPEGSLSTQMTSAFVIQDFNRDKAAAKRPQVLIGILSAGFLEFGALFAAGKSS
jgi:hypothetical protein